MGFALRSASAGASAGTASAGVSSGPASTGFSPGFASSRSASVGFASGSASTDPSPVVLSFFAVCSSSARSFVGLLGVRGLSRCEPRRFAASARRCCNDTRPVDRVGVSLAGGGVASGWARFSGDGCDTFANQDCSGARRELSSGVIGILGASARFSVSGVTSASRCCSGTRGRRLFSLGVAGASATSDLAPLSGGGASPGAGAGFAGTSSASALASLTASTASALALPAASTASALALPAASTASALAPPAASSASALAPPAASTVSALALPATSTASALALPAASTASGLAPPAGTLTGSAAARVSGSLLNDSIASSCGDAVAGGRLLNVRRLR